MRIKVSELLDQRKDIEINMNMLRCAFDNSVFQPIDTNYVKIEIADYDALQIILNDCIFLIDRMLEEASVNVE